MSTIHRPSFLLGGGLVAAILGFVAVLLLRPWDHTLPGNARAGEGPGGLADRARPPADVATEERAETRPPYERPSRMEVPERSELLSLADLRQLLFSSRRLDQVRAIELLLAQGTPEAVQALLDAFLTSSDPILLALVEEAMLKSSLDLAPGLMSALYASTDPQRLSRLAGMLTQLAAKRPDLEQKVVGLFIEALGDPSLNPEHAKAIEDALVALGTRALDPLAAYLADPQSDPRGAGTVAAVLSRLDAAHGNAVRERVRAGFEAMRKVLDDPALTTAEKDAARKKTGSLAWAVGNRPPAEHDLLARDLVESFLGATDPAQAGTLAWGMTNLKGLSDPARFDTVQSILGSLPDQSDNALRQSYVWAVSQIVAAGYGARPLDANFYGMLNAAEDAWSRYQNDTQVSVQFRWLLAELHAYEKKKQGG